MCPTEGEPVPTSPVPTPSPAQSTKPGDDPTTDPAHVITKLLNGDRSNPQLSEEILSALFAEERHLQMLIISYQEKKAALIQWLTSEAHAIAATLEELLPTQTINGEEFKPRVRYELTDVDAEGEEAEKR